MFSLPPWLSLAALALANVVPLIGVFAWGWEAAGIVMFYWSENLVIGAMTIIKMLIVSPLGLFRAAFFVVHYGAFCAVHGMLAMSIFGLADGDIMEAGDWPFVLVFLEMLVGVVRAAFTVLPGEWLWGFAALAVSHGVSLIVNFVLRGEHRNHTAAELMGAPYKRIFIMHFAVLFGGWGAAALGSPLPLLLILIVLKAVIDVRAHLNEHNLPLPFRGETEAA